MGKSLGQMDIKASHPEEGEVEGVGQREVPKELWTLSSTQDHKGHAVRQRI